MNSISQRLFFSLIAGTVAVVSVFVLLVSVLRAPAQTASTTDRRYETKDARNGHGLPLRDLEVVSADRRWIATTLGGVSTLVGPEASRLRGAEEPPLVLGDNVSDIVFSPDGRYLAYTQGQVGDENIMLLSLPPTAPAQVLVGWDGPDLYPVFSDDGKRLAFVSWRSGTGLNSIYVLDIQSGAASAVQVTNVGLKRSPSVPAAASPAPDGVEYFRFEGDTLRWTADGVEYSAELPR